MVFGASLLEAYPLPLSQASKNFCAFDSIEAALQE